MRGTDSDLIKPAGYGEPLFLIAGNNGGGHYSITSSTYSDLDSRLRGRKYCDGRPIQIDLVLPCVNNWTVGNAISVTVNIDGVTPVDDWFFYDQLLGNTGPWMGNCGRKIFNLNRGLHTFAVQVRSTAGVQGFVCGDTNFEPTLTVVEI